MRTKKGIVVSNKMEKTVVVSVETYEAHPKYKKNFKITKKFAAHDETNACNIGDEVVIKETRQLSKTKKWEVVK